MASTENNPPTFKPAPELEWTASGQLTPESEVRLREWQANQWAALLNTPIVKADPSLAEPWPKVSPEERELINQRLVESYSSNPLYQQMAKASGDEAEYWKNFSISHGIHTLPRSKPCSPEE